MKKMFLFLSFISLFYSCSPEEKGPDLTKIEWYFELKKTTATTAEYDIPSVFPDSDLKIGISKKEEENFSVLRLESNYKLEPYTEYQVALYNTRTKEVSEKREYFTTTPFDVNIHDFFYESTSENLIASAEGYTHKIYLDNLSPLVDEIEVKLISVDGEGEEVTVEQVEIRNDSLVFTLPTDLVPNDPYVESKDFRMSYIVDNVEYSFGSLEDGKQTPFEIFNSTPTIENVAVGLVNVGYCPEMDHYALKLSGRFMAVYGYGSIGGIVDHKITAYITGVDNDKFIILETMGSDPCQYFYRSWNLNIEEERGLEPFHSCFYLTGIVPKSQNFLFPGDYNIRLAFEYGTSFFQTEEFFFTIEE